MFRPVSACHIQKSTNMARVQCVLCKLSMFSLTRYSCLCANNLVLLEINIQKKRKHPAQSPSDCVTVEIYTSWPKFLFSSHVFCVCVCKKIQHA